MRKSIGAIARQWLTVVAVLMAIAVNALSNFFPPLGQNIGQISNTTLGGVLVTPDGYAFAIWGVIYIGLIAYSIYQALPAQRTDSVCQQISLALIGACVLQMAWVLAFLLYQFWLSVALMFAIVGCLWVAYLRSRSVRPTRTRRWLLQSPISVYFGWITVAAVVNVASAIYATPVQDDPLLGQPYSLVTNEVFGLGAEVWTVILMIVSASIAARIAWRHSDAAYPAVTAWALSAIAVRHSNDIAPVTIVGVAGAILLSVLIVRIVASGQGRPRPLDIASD